MTKSKLLHGANPVLIEWIDSMGTSGWQKTFQTADMRCVSVGHLVTKLKDRVIICLSLSPYSGGDYMEIPRVAIKKIRKLKL